MALFDHFDAFEIGALLFIFGGLALYVGYPLSVLNVPLNAASMFLSIPISILGMAGGSGSAVLVAAAILLFLAYYSLGTQYLGEAFWALVFFALIAIMLGY